MIILKTHDFINKLIGITYFEGSGRANVEVAPEVPSASQLVSSETIGPKDQTLRSFRIASCLTRDSGDHHN